MCQFVCLCWLTLSHNYELDNKNQSLYLFLFHVLYKSKLQNIDQVQNNSRTSLILSIYLK